MKTIDDILLIPILQSGDKLCHYTSAAGLKGICEGEFWATERSFLNDAMEFQVATEVFCEIVNAHVHDQNINRTIQRLVRDEIEKFQNPELLTDRSAAYGGDYVISFCLDYDSPLMWSSYSDYVGYCIQFNYEKIVRLFKDKFKYGFFHGQVVYNHEEQIRSIEETINRSYFQDTGEFAHINQWEDIERMSTSELKKWCEYVSVEVSAYNMFFKLPCFEGENEYRFVLMATHDGGFYKPSELWKQHFRIKDEVLIPYIKVPIDTLESMEKVLIGAKNKSDIAIRGLQHMFRNKEYNIDIERSAFPLRY